MVRIKFYHNYDRNKRVIYLFETFIGEHFIDGRWNNLVVCDKDEDVSVCFNNYHDWMDPKKTIVIDIEPPYSSFYSDRNPGLVYKTKSGLEPLGWVIHLGIGYNKLNSSIGVNKTKNISSICSKLMCHVNQTNRLDFVSDYKSRFELDIFGFYNNELPLDRKYMGMLDYKYHIQAENFIAPFHASEKIMDSILAENLCFYYGAPNISNIIDEKAIVQIDMNDHAGSFKIINDHIRLDSFKHKRKIILEEKRRILNDLQLAPKLSKIINGS